MSRKSRGNWALNRVRVVARMSVLTRSSVRPAASGSVIIAVKKGGNDVRNTVVESGGTTIYN